MEKLGLLPASLPKASRFGIRRPAMRRFLYLLSAFWTASSLFATCAQAKSCVWKVTSPGGQTLYLAGTVHALRASDYPLPAAYDRAFKASAELVFETDPHASAETWQRRVDRAAQLPGRATLKDKVDPRTYAYIRRVLGGIKGAADPEKKIERMRPWALSWMLEAPGKLRGVTQSHGVESYLQAKVGKTGKRMSGLVSLDQHIAVFGGMSDAENEMFLLLQFLHLDTHRAEYTRTVAAWRRGDAPAIDAAIRGDYREAPSLYRRIITDRNRAWMPKIESFLRPRQRTRMIVVGAAHTAGKEGLPALLQARGCRVEQL
jgi:uncharacterized protein YbaP (TraB family)